MAQHTVDWYIRKISDMSNPFGDKLIKLLYETNKEGLMYVTVEEAKEFYEKLIDKQNE